ncbi:hypothetical protein F4811DRAFT_556351 [Daldinia bambusicola]|nr:hypothetical protein F4811DRAFT_556351 [Daldinia bambusicola]
MIPLRIDKGWTLVCCRNPKRIKVSYPIAIINPTDSDHKLRATLDFLEDWVPGEEDSGLHVILNAKAMVNSRVPETRPLDRNVCRTIRMKYFITALNEMQQAVSKAANKRSTAAKA